MPHTDTTSHIVTHMKLTPSIPVLSIAPRKRRTTRSYAEITMKAADWFYLAAMLTGFAAWVQLLFLFVPGLVRGLANLIHHWS